MNGLLVCLLAYCGHALGDFVLQTDFLAKFKKKSAWGEGDKTSWMFVLLGHCLLWGLCVYLPMFAYQGWVITWWLGMLFAANVVVHFFADWLKCEGKTNLMQDQLIHYAQIAISLAVLLGVK